MGRIRLQWWRDTIDALCASDAPRLNHPVAKPLADAIARHGLSRHHFETLIDARDSTIEGLPTANLADFIDYAEATSAPLAALFLEVLGATDWPEAGRAATAAAGRHTSIAWALTGLLRALPFNAARDRTTLPAELFARHRVLPCAATGKTHDPRALVPLVAEVATLAHSHIDEARRLAGYVQKAALPLLLQATLAKLYLDSLAKSGHDVSAACVQRHPLAPLLLTWKAVWGRY